MFRKLIVLPLGALLFSSALSMAGCGAKVTVDKPSGAGGVGGSGGTGGVIGGTGGTGVTVGTGGAQSSSVSSSSNVTTSVSTSVTTTTGPTSTSVTTSVSSGTTTSTCDNTGVCQDMDQDPTNDCVACAFAGPCADPLSVCVQDKDCCLQQPDGQCSPQSFVGCINNCAPDDMACNQKCQMQHPVGAKEYYSLINCVLCQECPIDCGQLGGNCP